jgi:hypothetical protein
MTTPKLERFKVCPGIRGDQYGFEAYTTAGGRWVSRRFPVGTDVVFMQQWRSNMKRTMELDRALTPQKIMAARAPKGWCYVYFVRAGEVVKIGRAVDVADRIRNMQVGHHEPLKLLAAVPAHAALEAELHRHFAVEREDGEWFRLSPRLMAYIEGVRQNLNPVALLFDQQAAQSP